ncbi:hypothetical protein DYBT9275_02813 [Dyadobacter sp. CECT 9275]|uniref:GYF domain-containing protein n=1 Tax=Dyadobacter helix TaxID=2822344 RepID=A0A916NC32_9BACT|nr:DUF4339 domain-containing protein [Dyadobacter sp. CECT 9275]CAG5002121.1 hypothetical protein DYBT9275_02813 [Dyadobacter sp. CECT 9275]
MEKKYYFLKGSSQMGPYTIEEINIFNLPPDTLVWYEELGPWKKLKDAPEMWNRTNRHLAPVKDNSRYYWYVGGVVAFIFVVAVYIVGTKKEGSQEVAEAFASKFATNMMKVCNPSTGKNATYYMKDWECDDKRYSIDVTSYWYGQPYGGYECKHEVRVLLEVDEDGSNADYKVLGTNDCMENDARTDSNIRSALNR